MWKTTAFVFAFIVILAAAEPAHAQCPSTEGQSPDVTHFRDNASAQDLSDYGVIFEDAGKPECAFSAAGALYKKVFSTLNPTITEGMAPWPHFDNQVYENVWPYQGWQQGALASLVYSTALRLGAQGKLSKPLDDLLRRVPYVMKVDHFCGFDNGNWVNQNSCMDDYAVGASGYGWQAAYQTQRGYNAWSAAYYARQAIASALSTDSSVCVKLYTQPNPAPARGPCVGNVNDLWLSNGVAVGLRSGESLPYGAGLMTSIASASVGLDQTQWPLSLSPDEQKVAKELLVEASLHTPDIYSWAAESPTHPSHNCYYFTLENGQVHTSQDHACGNDGPRYGAGMFPVKRFYDFYAPIGGSLPGYDFSTFQPELFCNNFSFVQGQFPCNFFHPGRRAIYGTLGQAWVKNTPPLSGQLGDYTATLRTWNGNYVSWQRVGNLDLNAIATQAGEAEQFSLLDVNRGWLVDGDKVTLQTLAAGDGRWVSAGAPGTMWPMTAGELFPHETRETYVVHKWNGTGTINSGDQVTLTCGNGNYYVAAENGGGDSMTCVHVQPVTWEVFTLNYTHN